METKKCPANIGEVLSEYFRREGYKNNLRYTYNYSSMSTDGSIYFFTDRSSPPLSIVITKGCEKNDWRRVTTSILTNDPRVKEFIQPICLKYEKEMYEYYKDYL